MRTFLSVLVLSLVAVLSSACASTAKCSSCTSAQGVVDTVAKQHAECTRLSVHCAMAGGAKCCASTQADKVGKASDKEDLEAMQTGKAVVLDEAGSFDVTVPMRGKDGKFQSACGVTLKGAGMSREQAVAKATAIAQAVEGGLGGSCECCCK